MEWMNAYTESIEPTPEDISNFIANPLWEELNQFITENYDAKPDYSYSGCSAQTGWNVKYKKGGKALCTLYPMNGYFIALVVIGKKELPEAEMIMPTCTGYVRDLFEKTEMMGQMGMWLMIDVKDEDILEDVMNLIQIRRKIKSRGK